jgi:hypothetical protein
MDPHTIRTLTVCFNMEKRLAQINVIPRYIECDTVENVLHELERMAPMIRAKRDAGEVCRVVVVVD